MKKSKAIKYLSYIIIFITVFSCAQSSLGEEITSIGNYKIDKNLELRIWTQKGLLMYDIVSDKKEVIASNSEEISQYQGWGFFLDSHKNVWVFSADRGSCRWNFSAQTKTYQQEWFNRKLYKHEVPEALSKSSLKKYLKR